MFVLPLALQRALNCTHAAGLKLVNGASLCPTRARIFHTAPMPTQFLLAEFLSVKCIFVAAVDFECSLHLHLVCVCVFYFSTDAVAPTEWALQQLKRRIKTDSLKFKLIRCMHEAGLATCQVVNAARVHSHTHTDTRS